MKIMTNAIHAKKTSPLVNDEIIFYNEEPRDRRDISPWPSFTFAGDTPADVARKALDVCKETGPDQYDRSGNDR